MERFDVLRGIIKNEFEIEEVEGHFLLKKVDDIRYNNIYIDIVETSDNFGVNYLELRLSYLDRLEIKRFHRGDMKFSINGMVENLKLNDIDILPLEPIKVLIKSKKDRNIEDIVKYRHDNIINTGIIKDIVETTDDGIIYMILITSRELI